MFSLLSPVKGNLVAIRAEGTLTDADYKEFLPQLEAVIAEQKRIRLFVDMTGFEGWDLHGAWDDFVFGLKHWGSFEQVAMVGTEAWEAKAARIADLLIRGEVRFFPADEVDAAWKWIGE